MSHVSPFRPPLVQVFGCALFVAGCGGESDPTSASSGATSSTGVACEGGAGGASAYVPTPADIQFAAVSALPQGEHLLINDWDEQPNGLWAMDPDGQNLSEVFRAYRIWSMGVSHAADRIAFSSGDPDQLAHYGTDVGDAIQHTFIYDVATQVAENVAFGNINDECHAFAPDDKSVYVCRRSDFDAAGTSKSYRIGKIDPACKTFEWVTDETSSLHTLYPQPLPSGKEMLFTTIPVPTGTRKIIRRVLDTGEETAIATNANEPVLSPDGTRFLYVDYGDAGKLHAVGLDGANDVVVLASKGAEGYRYSPDGTRVAYMLFDDALQCSHVEIVSADGAQAASPSRIYDCGAQGRFVTELAWINRP